MTIGKNIARYRKMAGFTQKELAEKCNCATGTIQQYELDKRTPKIKQLCNIAKVLNVPVDYLFGDTTIGIMTEADVMQIDYWISHNNRELEFQEKLLDNDCVIFKKDNYYILQKRVSGNYGKRIRISEAEYKTLVNDIDILTSFLTKFLLDKIFDSHDYYFYDDPDSTEQNSDEDTQ